MTDPPQQTCFRKADPISDAQRLIRIVCENCAETVDPTEEMFDATGVSKQAARKFNWRIGRVVRWAIKTASKTAIDVAINAAIEIDPDQPFWLYGNLAEAYFQQGRRRAALVSLRKAINRDPWPLTTDLRFAGLLKQHKCKADIAAALDRARRVKPDHPSVCGMRWGSDAAGGVATGRVIWYVA